MSSSAASARGMLAAAFASGAAAPPAYRHQSGVGSAFFAEDAADAAGLSDALALDEECVLTSGDFRCVWAGPRSVH